MNNLEDILCFTSKCIQYKILRQPAFLNANQFVAGQFRKGFGRERTIFFFSVKIVS